MTLVILYVILTTNVGFVKKNRSRIYAKANTRTRKKATAATVKRWDLAKFVLKTNCISQVLRMPSERSHDADRGFFNDIFCYFTDKSKELYKAHPELYNNPGY